MKCNDVKQLLEVNRGKGSCSVYEARKEQSTEECGPARKSAKKKKKKYRSDSKDDPFHFAPVIEATRLLLNTPQNIYSPIICSIKRTDIRQELASRSMTPF